MHCATGVATLLRVGVVECFELRRGSIRDSPVAQPATRPVQQAVPSHCERSAGRLTGRSAPDEQIYRVQAPTVRQHRGGVTSHVIESSAEQRESLVGEIVNGWGDIGLASELRLDGVPVSRLDIHEVARHERSDMGVD